MTLAVLNTWRLGKDILYRVRLAPCAQRTEWKPKPI